MKKERLEKKDWLKVHKVVDNIRDETLAKVVGTIILWYKLGSAKEELIGRTHGVCEK